MSLKEMIERDNKIFFNTNDFADLHSVNGVQVPVIIDEDKLCEMKINSKFAPYIAESNLLLFIKLKDMGYIPAKGSVIEFDNSQYEVKEVIADDFVLQIILSEVV